jgi:predicted dinucleotide-binding enzyme
MKNLRISIIGSGWVGTAIGEGFRQNGYDVIFQPSAHGSSARFFSASSVSLIVCFNGPPVLSAFCSAMALNNENRIAFNLLINDTLPISSASSQFCQS